LRDQNEIVAIAHPGWENGFPPGDLKYLSNYDLLEVLDANWHSVAQWDSALSSGHPVYIVGMMMHMTFLTLMTSAVAARLSIHPPSVHQT